MKIMGNVQNVNLFHKFYVLTFRQRKIFIKKFVRWARSTVVPRGIRIAETRVRFSPGPQGSRF